MCGSGSALLTSFLKIRALKIVCHREGAFLIGVIHVIEGVPVIDELNRIAALD
jgi:hypothetical protein